MPALQTIVCPPRNALIPSQRSEQATTGNRYWLPPYVFALCTYKVIDSECDGIDIVAIKSNFN